MIASTSPNESFDDSNSVFIMLRGLGLLAFTPLMIAFNAYFWSITGVNHILIFNLNPRSGALDWHRPYH